MKEFMMAHPWMCFWLVVIVVVVLDNMVDNWAKSRRFKYDGPKRRKEDNPEFFRDR